MWVSMNWLIDWLSTIVIGNLYKHYKITTKKSDNWYIKFILSIMWVLKWKKYEMSKKIVFQKSVLD